MLSDMDGGCGEVSAMPLQMVSPRVLQGRRGVGTVGSVVQTSGDEVWKMQIHPLFKEDR